jgi:putative ABC transport system permease protein
MANTVALSTLERRRQIGVLKSIGLKSHRVLLIMLIESTLVALLSAAIGIGLSSLAITIFTSFSGQAIPLPREARGVAIMLVIAAVLIGWLSTFLSANVAVRERVMNVLRYE